MQDIKLPESDQQLKESVLQEDVVTTKPAKTTWIAVLVAILVIVLAVVGVVLTLTKNQVEDELDLSVDAEILELHDIEDNLADWEDDYFELEPLDEEGVDEAIVDIDGLLEEVDNLEEELQDINIDDLLN